MKTFKLMSLQVVEEFGLIDIALRDGLIINKEDDQRSWLLEAYIHCSYEKYFQSMLDVGNEVTLQVYISRKENDPAYFKGNLIAIHTLGDYITILFKGTVNRSRNDYAERLLTTLVDNGLSGQELLEAFREKMVSRPLLR